MKKVLVVFAGLVGLFLFACNAFAADPKQAQTPPTSAKPQPALTTEEKKRLFDEVTGASHPASGSSTQQQPNANVVKPDTSKADATVVKPQTTTTNQPMNGKPKSGAAANNAGVAAVPAKTKMVAAAKPVKAKRWVRGYRRIYRISCCGCYYGPRYYYKARYYYSARYYRPVRYAYYRSRHYGYRHYRHYRHIYYRPVYYRHSYRRHRY